MTSTLTDHPQPTRDTARPRRAGHLRLAAVPAWVVPCLAALAVLVQRAPGLALPLSPDEAGFLALAHQWRPGTSLYGDLWVDRPPLLVTLYRFADDLGGTVPLRVMGALAAAATVLLLAAVTRCLTRSPRATAVTAVVAAALLASPVAGASEVDGELLAAPFVALGVLGAVVALRQGARRSRLHGALALGGGTAAAVLVKQNMVDPAVVATLLAAVALGRRRTTARQLLAVVATAAAGAATVVGLVAAWTAAHGTSVGGVLWAMYPFRVEAARTLAASTSQAAGHRTLLLVGAAAAAGLVTLLVAAVVAAAADLGRRRGRPESLLLLVGLGWAAWAVASIAMGGNGWTHYLVQLASPVALVGGLLGVHRPRTAGVLTAWCVSAALVSTVVAGAAPSRLDDQHLGTAIGAASRPGDSVVVAWGHAGVVRASGLPSTYPYLWSLPVKTLDPDLRRLDRTLAGPQAPTWFVVEHRLRTWGLRTDATAALLQGRYVPVLRACDATVYRRADLVRPDPVLTHPCDTQEVPR